MHRAGTISELFGNGLLWRGSEERPNEVAITTGDCHVASSAPRNDERGNDERGNDKSQRVARFGIPEIDQALPHNGLPLGELHLFSLSNASSLTSSSGDWLVPLTILSLLAASARCLTPSTVVWIGRRTWPTPHLLELAFKKASPSHDATEYETTMHDTTLESLLGIDSPWSWKNNCLFIDPPNDEKRLWAITQALHNRAVSSVVADAHNFPLNAWRRLQLAARSGETLGLLARSPKEHSRPSTASSVWQVTPVTSSSDMPRWELSLERARAVQTPLQWIIEQQDTAPDEALSLGIPADARRRTLQVAPAPAATAARAAAR